MPAQISRLLVVKGAELNFEDNERSGISRDILKHFLSGRGVLDDIQEEISKTIQGAEIGEGRIEGHRRGEIKQRNNLANELQKIDELFEEIEQIYSGGERLDLELKVKRLEQAIGELETAKRHHAYQIDQEIRQYEKRLERLPQNDLEQLNDDFRRLEEVKTRIDRQEQNLERAAGKSEHYPWLEEAIGVYEARAARGKTGVSLAYPVVIAIALVVAVILSFIRFPLGTLVLVIVVAALGWQYVRGYRAALENAVDIDEVRKLEAEFQNRFDQPLSGLPQMKAMREAMAQAYHSAKALRASLDEERHELDQIQRRMDASLSTLTGGPIPEENWGEALRKLNEFRERLQSKREQARLELAALGVDESDYHAEATTVTYSLEKLKGLRDKLEAAEAELQEKTNELRNLKQRISDKTGDEITVAWETLIENLQRKRQDVSDEYRDITAEILAGILINEQLDVIRAQEEEKIREKLASATVCRPVHRVTGRYTGVVYQDGEVHVADDYGQFALADLSTGAREQVLLGLRIGFAAHTLQADSLFLLLDDAFQHADWQRRMRLLEQTVDLARDGWQIIYFTMDDHIRDLFNEAGHSYFPGQYQYHVLNA